MLREYSRLFRRFNIFFDGILIIISFFTGFYFRNQYSPLYTLDAYIWMLPIQVLLWLSFMYVLGMYNSFRIKSLVRIIMTVFQAAFWALLSFSTLMFFSKSGYISRSMILIMFGTATTLLCLHKILLVFMFRGLRRRGLNFRNILIVGTGPRAQAFIKSVVNNKDFGLKIVGLVDDERERIGTKVLNFSILGMIEDIPRILRNHPIDHVFYVVPRTWLERIEQSILYCETVGVTANVAIDLYKLSFTAARDNSVFGTPMLTFEPITAQKGMLIVKRLIDVLVSTILMILLFPFLVVVAVVIRLDSRGPIFFCQERCTLNGRMFPLYKFRTMGIDAEERLKDLMKNNEMQGPAFKISKDPRLTRVGAFLRKYSIDELPQLWNVLCGHMSLVGPRPPIQSEVVRYDCWQRRRLSMRPGLTCIWQTSGRNNIKSFDEWIKLDLQYIDNWSLALDFRILLKTIPAVFSGSGAK